MNSKQRRQQKRLISRTVDFFCEGVEEILNDVEKRGQDAVNEHRSQLEEFKKLMARAAEGKG